MLSGSGCAGTTLFRVVDLVVVRQGRADVGVVRLARFGIGHIRGGDVVRNAVEVLNIARPLRAAGGATDRAAEANRDDKAKAEQRHGATSDLAMMKI